MIRRLLGLAPLVSILVLAGCASTVQENHYFAAYKDSGDGKREPTQFYRLSVDGSSNFANTRYLTGYFDERAVSLLFNELKSYKDGPSNTHKLFDGTVGPPGAAAGMKLEPLSPTVENGAFVLIMSTNADAIASTIGSFAESQVIADTLTRMLNKDRYIAKTESDAKLSVQKAEATALVAQFEAQTRAAKKADSGERAAVAYRRALTVLAQGLGYSGAEFESLKVARDWFALAGATQSGVAQ